MKTRNVDLNNTSLLTNHIVKHIILEAPTVSELQKKVQEYKLILVKAITSAYRLSHLVFKNDGSFHISPTGSYQTAIIMTFDGKKKEEITKPEKTLQYVKQLMALESKKQHESNVITGSQTLTKDKTHIQTFIIEADSQKQLDEKISSKQKDLLEEIIENANLIDISFFTTAKHQDSQTGKITLTITANYTCREKTIKKTEYTDIDQSGNR